MISFEYERERKDIDKNVLGKKITTPIWLGSYNYDMP